MTECNLLSDKKHRIINPVIGRIVEILNYRRYRHCITHHTHHHIQVHGPGDMHGHTHASTHTCKRPDRKTSTTCSPLHTRPILKCEHIQIYTVIMSCTLDVEPPTK